MGFDNIPEITACDLNGPLYDLNSTYVLIEGNEYPKTVKISLSQLKQWLTGELSSRINNVAKEASRNRGPRFVGPRLH